jgi:hypothetical protein
MGQGILSRSWPVLSFSAPAFALPGDRIAQLEDDAAEPVMRFGVLGDIADDVAQVDLYWFFTEIISLPRPLAVRSCARRCQ